MIGDDSIEVYIPLHLTFSVQRLVATAAPHPAQTKVLVATNSAMSCLLFQSVAMIVVFTLLLWVRIPRVLIFVLLRRHQHCCEAFLRPHHVELTSLAPFFAST